MVLTRSSESGPPVNEDRKAIPVAAMVESIIGCKWSVLLLGLLADGCTRPSALLQGTRNESRTDDPVSVSRSAAPQEHEDGSNQRRP